MGQGTNVRQAVRRWGRYLAGCLLAAAFLADTTLAQETQAGPSAGASLPIMVVDFQGVVRQSAAAASIQRQVGIVQDSYQAKYRDLEERLRAMESELADLRGKLDEEEFVNRRREFEREVTEQQREAQAERTLLDEALNRSMALVRSAALEVIAEFADEEGVSLVLNKADTILSDRDLDRTDEVLAELDRRLPSVQVDLEAADPGQTQQPSTNGDGAETAND